MKRIAGKDGVELAGIVAGRRQDRIGHDHVSTRLRLCIARALRESQGEDDVRQPSRRRAPRLRQLRGLQLPLLRRETNALHNSGDIKDTCMPQLISATSNRAGWISTLPLRCYPTKVSVIEGAGIADRNAPLHMPRDVTLPKISRRCQQGKTGWSSEKGILNDTG